MNFKIRTETLADAEAIEALTARAFEDAAHTSHTEQYIVNALREAGALSLSLVAEDGGSLVGHVALSPVSLSDGSPGWFGLGPLSVLPEFQRRGIGSALMREALERLRRRGAIGCVVLGDPRYYGRFGFTADPRLTLEGVPPEYFQAVRFVACAAEGRVDYHPAFATV
jgi:putative acetyltransferase